MAKAYSDDLRQKVLKRHQAGEETLEDLADRFEVSLGWVKKISAAFTRTGKMERPRPARLGRKSKMTPELDALIRTAVAGQLARTLKSSGFQSCGPVPAPALFAGVSRHFARLGASAAFADFAGFRGRCGRRIGASAVSGHETA